MTKYFAVHAAEYGIRTNAVSPGGIRNPDNPQGENFQQNYGYRCPMGRMAETHEMIGAVLFLLSPAANYINGQNIVVDGGTTCW
jgi:NAD(P)-dependent dehydrogenase (short-subunit alcohol dehydrogenase family)